jgi:hypothetical protein
VPRVVIRHARQDPEPECMGTQRAVLGLPGLRQLLLRRGEGTATFTGPRLSHDELIHPYLGAAASVFSRWCGREVYHAGAFVCGGLAWAVVGGREAGKSSLLAALAARGLPVLSDDLVVTDGHQAFCGPRTIDLRRLAPGTTAPVTPVRGASRWRLALPPAARRGAPRRVDLPALARRRERCTRFRHPARWPGSPRGERGLPCRRIPRSCWRSPPAQDGTLAARLTGPGWIRPWT